MAYKPSAGSQKNEEHAFQRIQKGLKNGTLKSPLFFFGRETYLIQWAIEAIVNRYINPATAVLEYAKLQGSDITLSEIRNNCETLPMFSEKRVVLINDFGPLYSTRSKNISESDEKELCEYVKQLPETTLLIFTAPSTDKRKRLYKTIVECGGAYEFGPLSRALLAGTVQKRLAQAGKRAGASAVSVFMDHSGYFDKDTDYTMFNVDNDLKKAVAYARGDEVTAEDFLSVISGNIDTDVFAMLDAVSKGNKPEAFVRLHHMLDSGEKVHPLLALICSQFEIMVCVREMKEEGQSFASIQKTLGVHEFRLKKAMQFSEGYSTAKLKEILAGAYGVDKKIKSGLLSDVMAMELFIAEM